MHYTQLTYLFAASRRHIWS